MLFDEFAAVIESVAALSVPVMIVGDVNIYLDDPSLPTSINFNNIISECDLKQHVTSPTHEAGHTLDVVITNNTFDIKITVDSPIFSDHSLISVGLFLHDASKPEVILCRLKPDTTGRCWTVMLSGVTFCHQTSSRSRLTTVIVSVMCTIAVSASWSTSTHR